ncbi:hypothetical protein L9F63_019773 [Diploptera punctata]|uniref:Uncharacterized protein n=1 Tax=Diploptera punctata TaxID=6984 RepID=A0AAD7ZTZ2_DIPPU|nr:hypothetical protein L9F63_019773 [Diploptera punctata]
MDEVRIVTSGIRYKKNNMQRIMLFLLITSLLLEYTASQRRKGRPIPTSGLRSSKPKRTNSPGNQSSKGGQIAAVSRPKATGSSGNQGYGGRNKGRDRVISSATG